MLSQCFVAVDSGGAAGFADLRTCSRTLIKPARDIDDHQVSLVFPSSRCTKVVSSPYPTRAPSANAFSKSAWVLAMTLSMSAHCERGIAHSATYVYIRGFSLTSAVCPKTAIAEIAAMSANAINASAHFLNTITPLPFRRFFDRGFPILRWNRMIERGYKDQKERIALSVLRVRETITQFQRESRKCPTVPDEFA